MIDTHKLVQQSKVFRDLLDRGLYFEAHEAMEVLWFDLRHTKDDEVRFIRAQINAAVSFELLKRNRPKSFLKPWGFYLNNKDLFHKVKEEHKMIYAINLEKIEAIKAKHDV